VSLASRADLDELVARLPGTVWRGRAVSGSVDSRDRLATGFEDLDALLEGGLPRGRLTELVAPVTAGATSLVYRLCLQVTRSALAAWIDAPDALDPASAAAAGIELERMLWVRPPDLGTALVATELLLNLGGFPLVLLDAGVVGDPALREPGLAASSRGHEPTRGSAQGVERGSSRGSGRRMPRRRDPAPHTWLRLARAAARSHSVLLVLKRRRGREPSLESWASLRLDLDTAAPSWDREKGAPPLLTGLDLLVSIGRGRGAEQGRAVRLSVRGF
jgi:hypothetical protein